MRTPWERYSLVSQTEGYWIKKRKKFNAYRRPTMFPPRRDGETLVPDQVSPEMSYGGRSGPCLLCWFFSPSSVYLTVCPNILHSSIVDFFVIILELGVDIYIKAVWSQDSFSSWLDLLTTPPSSLLFLGAFANRAGVFSCFPIKQLP